MATDRLQIGRRSFLIGTGAVALAAVVPAALAHEDWPEYVKFLEPEEMWEREWQRSFWRHQTVWRPGHEMFGLGIRVSMLDVADGRVPVLMRSYNRSLELTRRKHGWPQEMIRAAANEREDKRWIKEDGVWLRHRSGIHPYSGPVPAGFGA